MTNQALDALTQKAKHLNDHVPKLLLAGDGTWRYADGNSCSQRDLMCHLIVAGNLATEIAAELAAEPRRKMPKGEDS